MLEADKIKLEDDATVRNPEGTDHPWIPADITSTSLRKSMADENALPVSLPGKTIS